MKKFGIIISGLGYDDGSSVWDVCYILREIERYGAKVFPYVPRESVERNIPGIRRKSSPMRDFSKEASLLVRGDVFFIDDADPKELDALLFPGGKGNIKILSSILRDGTEAQVIPELRELVAGVYVREKFIGALGYGAALVAFILKSRIKPIITINDDAQIVEVIKSVGADVMKVQPHEVIFDEENKILTSPGTSPGSSLFRASLGIEVLIKRILGKK